jgi:DNA polymerase elongation subunit (family B)
VQVALRMKARGKRDGTRAGNVVQYIICTDKGAEPGANVGLAARAYHPSELQENSNLAVDTHYYLSQQLHPVVARILAPLDMTSEARLAECLGLDPSKFKKPMPVSEKLASVRPFTLCYYLQCSGCACEDLSQFWERLEVPAAL